MPLEARLTVSRELSEDRKKWSLIMFVVGAYVKGMFFTSMASRSRSVIASESDLAGIFAGGVKNT